MIPRALKESDARLGPYALAGKNSIGRSPLKKYILQFIFAITFLSSVLSPLARAAGTEFPHYLDVNGRRYEAFQQKYPEMPFDLAAAYVNADVDKGFYKDIQTVKKPDNLGVIINKNFALPSDWEPSGLVYIDGRRQLRKEAAEQFSAMKTAIEKEGLGLFVRSAYRSRSSQASSYNSLLNRYGAATADMNVARPGHSEHQLGLALDLVHKAGTSGPLSSMGFGDSKSFAWLVENGHKYGFILRYPKGLAEFHGYVYEPWHWRYVGPEIATAMRDEGIATLEEYYGRHVAPGLSRPMQKTSPATTFGALR